MNVLATAVVAAVFSSAACLCAGDALAQTASTTTAVPQPAPSTPLQLQLPADPPLVAPGENADNAIVDANDNARIEEDGRDPQVHGRLTTGIGYSRGHGTRTMSAADLDVSGRTKGGGNYDVQIHVSQEKGPGFDPRHGLPYHGD